MAWVCFSFGLKPPPPGLSLSWIQGCRVASESFGISAGSARRLHLALQGDSLASNNVVLAFCLLRVMPMIMPRRAGRGSVGLC